MSKTEVFALADELTLLLKNAKKIPLTDSVMINQSTAVDLLKRIISSYDPSLETAQQILENEEHILVDAKAKAEETIQQELDSLLGHVDNTVATQLNELRLIRQNLVNIQFEDGEN